MKTTLWRSWFPPIPENQKSSVYGPVKSESPVYNTVDTLEPLNEFNFNGFSPVVTPSANNNDFTSFSEKNNQNDFSVFPRLNNLGTNDNINTGFSPSNNLNPFDKFLQGLNPWNKLYPSNTTSGHSNIIGCDPKSTHVEIKDAPKASDFANPTPTVGFGPNQINEKTPKSEQTVQPTIAPENTPNPADFTNPTPTVGPGPTSNPPITPVIETQDAPKEIVDHVEKTGRELANSNSIISTATKYEKSNKQKAYNEALYNEMLSMVTVPGQDITKSEAQEFLNDPEILDEVFIKMVDKHAGQTYDPNFEASVKAAYIVGCENAPPSTSYTPSFNPVDNSTASFLKLDPMAPMFKPSGDRSAVALQSMDSKMDMVSDPDNQVKDRVMNDSRTEGYFNAIVKEIREKPQDERLEYLAGITTKLSNADADMNIKLIKMTMGDEHNPEEGTLRHHIKTGDFSGSGWSPFDAKGKLTLDINNRNTIYNLVEMTMGEDFSGPDWAPFDAKDKQALDMGSLSTIYDSLNTMELFGSKEAKDLKEGISKSTAGRFAADSSFDFGGKAPVNHSSPLDKAFTIGDVHYYADNSTSSSFWTGIKNELEGLNGSNGGLVHQIDGMINTSMKQEINSFLTQMNKTDKAETDKNEKAQSPKPITDKERAEMVSNTDRAMEKYEAAKASGDKAEEAKALENLHKCLAIEINAVANDVGAPNGLSNQEEIDNYAIGAVTTDHHKGEEGQALLPHAQAANVINVAEKDEHAGKYDLDEDQNKLRVIGNKLPGYHSKQEVVDLVIQDPRVQGYIDNCIQSYQDQWHDSFLAGGPEKRVHYLAETMNACSSSPELVDKLSKELLGETMMDYFIHDVKRLPGAGSFFASEDEVTSSVTDLCDIYSPLRHKPTENKEKLGKKIVSLAHDHMEKLNGYRAQTPPLEALMDGTIDDYQPLNYLSYYVYQAVGTQGADPALLMKVGDIWQHESQFHHRAAENSITGDNKTSVEGLVYDGKLATLYEGIKEGVDHYFTETMPDQIAKKDKAQEQVTFQLLDRGAFIHPEDEDAVAAQDKFIDDFFKNNPEIEKSHIVLDDMCGRSLNLAHTLLSTEDGMYDNLTKYKVADEIDNSFKDHFFNDAKIMNAVNSSKYNESFLNEVDTVGFHKRTKADVLSGQIGKGAQGVRLFWHLWWDAHNCQWASSEAAKLAQQMDYTSFNKTLQVEVSDGIKVLYRRYGHEGVPVSPV
jgi:hypothetical protein